MLRNILALICLGVFGLVSLAEAHSAPNRPVDAAWKQNCPAEVCIADTVPNDALYGSQYGPQRIAAPAAWDVATGAASVVIAIVDTGIDCTHPDLVDKCVAGYDVTLGTTLSGQENSDDYGHGTHVASTAAGATNNSLGVAGICWTCKVMPVKVLTFGAGEWVNIAEGIIFATDNGASIINLSLGGIDFDAGMEAAVNYAWSQDVLVVSACGNNSVLFCSYPAAYANSMAVSCSDDRDRLCLFSSLGWEVDVSAPGLSVLAAVPLGSCNLCDPSGYRSVSGTSMSTPHVAGVAGLIRSLHPGLSNEQVYGLLQQSADDKGDSGFDVEYGFGRLNAAKAVTQTPPSSRLTKPPPPPPPLPYYIEIITPNEGSTVTGTFKACAIVPDIGERQRVIFNWQSTQKIDTSPDANGNYCVAFQAGKLSGSFALQVEAFYFGKPYNDSIYLLVE